MIRRDIFTAGTLTDTETWDTATGYTRTLNGSIVEQRALTPAEVAEVAAHDQTQARLANADTLTTQARTAIAGNQAAITAATTGQIATFKALTDTITGTLATTQTAVGQNRQAIDWCIDQILRLERQNIALIRTLGQILPALTDLLDTLDGTT